MSEKPDADDLRGETPLEDDVPEVYGVTRNPDGWSVSRRSLFAIGATAAAAAATAGAIVDRTDAAAQPVRVSLDRSASAAGGILAWRLTNDTGNAWGSDTTLVVETAGGESLTLHVPEAAAGETVTVSPEGPLSYAPASGSLKARLVVGEGEAYTVFLPLAFNYPTSTPPGDSGQVPPGETGATISGPSGETRWLPCGSPIPDGWTCICNCVTACTCDGHCTCDQVCTCDTVCSCVGAGHYWYPN